MRGSKRCSAMFAELAKSIHRLVIEQADQQVNAGRKFMHAALACVAARQAQQHVVTGLS
jgi:predicted GNAT family N-acyltransferase